MDYIYLKCLDRRVQANSVDQMPQNADSDPGLHSLLLLQQFLDTSVGSKIGVLKF